MKIHHFVYTRLVADKSPDGREGFQIGFRPDSLLDSRLLRRIKEYIIWEDTGIKEKKGVFFLELGSSPWLVVLHFSDLPGVEEKFPEFVGQRGGIFLCHGFLFPKEIWSKSTGLLPCMSLVKGEVISSFEQILSSPYVDVEKKLCLPFDVNKEEISKFNNFLPALDQWEWDLLLYLPKALSDSNAPPILFNAPPETAEKSMDRLCAYIPEELMPQISWDTNQDRGRLAYLPFKMMAWVNRKPIGGAPIEVDISAPNFALPSDTDTSFDGNAPFIKALAACKESIRTRDDIRQLWELGKFLTTGIKSRELSATSMLCLTFACAKEITSLFGQKLSTLDLNRGLSLDYLSEMLGPEDKLKILLADNHRDQAIKIMSEKIKEDIPPMQKLKLLLVPEIVKGGGGLIRALNKLVKEQQLQERDLSGLDEKESDKLALFLLKNFVSEPWLLELMNPAKPFGRKLITLLAEPENYRYLPEAVRFFLKNKGISLTTPLADLFIEELRYEHMYQELFSAPDPASFLFEVLEKRIQEKGFDQRMWPVAEMPQWKALKNRFQERESDQYMRPAKEMPQRQGQSHTPQPDSRGNDHNKQGFPLLRIFLNADFQHIPEEIESHTTLRSQLLEVCCKHHNMESDELLRRGFMPQEIERVSSDSMLGKITGFFSKKLFKRDKK